MGWTEFALAFAVFFASHALPVRPPLRTVLEARLGSRGFTLIYSALSIAVLAWLIGAAGRAPFVPLWGWAPWQGTVVLIMMLGVCLVLGLAIGRPNPLSFGGARDGAFDPTHAGVVRLTRHPLLLALSIWALAHVLPNGNLAHFILFGTFAVFALIGGRLVDRRKRRALGTEWVDLTEHVAASSWRRSFPVVDTALRLSAGMAIYATLLAIHPVLFGVAPWP